MIINSYSFAVGVPFVPTDIAGLQLWLDASQESFNDDDPVATWTDRSTAGNDATQATEADKPLFKTNILNSQPIMRFDGTDDFLSNTSPVTGSTHRTQFFVVKANGNTVTDGFVKWGDEASSGLDWLVTPEVAVRVNGSKVFNTAMGTSNFRILTIRFDGTTTGDIDGWLDGSALGVTSSSGATINTTSTANDAIGKTIITAADEFFSGDIAEIIVYDSALSVGNRGTVETYLSDKYNITI